MEKIIISVFVILSIIHFFSAIKCTHYHFLPKKTKNLKSPNFRFVKFFLLKTLKNPDFKLIVTAENYCLSV